MYSKSVVAKQNCIDYVEQLPSVFVFNLKRLYPWLYISLPGVSNGDARTTEAFSDQTNQVTYHIYPMHSIRQA